MSSFAGRSGALGAALLVAGCGSDPSTSPSPSPIPSNGVTVVSPNGAESFQVGGRIRVRWASSNAAFSSARLLVECGTGEWFDLATSSIDKKSADTALILPDSVYSSSARKNTIFPASSQCKIKIVDYVVNSIFDTSDAPFTIIGR